MSKKNNALLASAVTAGILMMGAQSATAAPSNAAAGAIEQRLKMMEDQMNAMKSELARVRAESASSAKVNELEAKVAKQATSSASGKKKNMVFFRGGYPRMEHSRSGELLAGGALGGGVAGTGLNSHGSDNGEGWYVGAGFDWNLSDNLFGLSDLAEVDAELMFDYKHLGKSINSLVSGYPTGTALAGAAGTMVNQVTMFSLSASPKIKFLPGSNFRPWIIPAGLAVHVISPPSSGVTVLNPGLMTAVGAEYKIWDNIYAGADFRYNFTGNDLKAHSTGIVPLKGVGTNGFTTGAYLGIGF
jgi:opacity protein-like surface antigen